LRIKSSRKSSKNYLHASLASFLIQIPKSTRSQRSQKAKAGTWNQHRQEREKPNRFSNVEIHAPLPFLFYNGKIPNMNPVRQPYFFKRLTNLIKTRKENGYKR
jgi:hypothetical protein